MHDHTDEGSLSIHHRVIYLFGVSWTNLQDRTIGYNGAAVGTVFAMVESFAAAR